MGGALTPRGDVALVALAAPGVPPPWLASPSASAVPPSPLEVSKSRSLEESKRRRANSPNSEEPRREKRQKEREGRRGRKRGS